MGRGHGQTRQVRSVRTRHRLTLAMAAAAILSVGCRSSQERLDDALRETRQAVLAVRPEVRIDDVRARIWSDSDDVLALTRDEASSLLHVFRAVLRSHSETVLHLSVSGPDSLSAAESSLLEIHPSSHHGLALPSRALFLVSEEAAESRGTLAHELGHLASARMGYAPALTRFSVVSGDELDPAWVDLDGLLALWALREGEAQITALAAGAFGRGGNEGLDRIWRAPAEVLPFPPSAILRGPGRITRPDGTVELVGEGEEYHFPGTLSSALYSLAYEKAVETILSYHESGEGVEETLRRTWSSWSYTTKELLFPGRREGSGPAKALRRRADPLREAGVTGAVSIGALLVHELLLNMARTSEEVAKRMVARYRDDLAVRTEEGGILWVVEWEDPQTAGEFAALYRSVLDAAGAPGQPRQRGRLVIAEVGEIRDSERLLSVVLGDE